ncbi:MAG: sensor histidine kinase [Actinomycetes bacterium]
MLRDAGVRTKLLAVLAIPTVLLVVVTTLMVGGQVSQARRAGNVNALTEVAIQVNRVVHSLQEERSATLTYLQDPGASNRARLKEQRKYTNQQLRELRALLADSPVGSMPEAVGAAVARSAAGHAELGAARSSIDGQRFFATETDVFYGKVIRADLDLPGVIAASGTPGLAQSLQAYGALATTIEYASHERDLVEVALLGGSLNEAEFAQVSALFAQQRQSLQDVQAKAPADAFAALDAALARADNRAVDRVRRNLPDLLKGKDPDFGAAVEWVGAANSRISAMTHTEALLVSEIATSASSTQDAQERSAFLLAAMSLIGLGLALMLAVALARRITRPLRRLTVAAGEIGDELPHMVERMQTPGAGPGVVVEPIPVESADEIGRLAEAFNTVNDVTVRVAKEQAALRASIAEMFVNVARRNQVLLGRQLKALDQMESREEDPDVLERLFTLDHLATRMRRNAESLLVLAGIDSTRRLRSALPLSDVIRTAVGEIEAFDRIDLSMSDDPEVSGRHALTVAHLLAELLENATHFSNPETRVVVSASMTGHGVDVTVTDYGLGMSDEEIADANEKIAHPPVAEIAVSQRLGLFVVGRLAARLEAAVSLRKGRAAGTVVTTTLPVSVFEGLAAAEQDPEQQPEQEIVPDQPAPNELPQDHLEQDDVSQDVLVGHVQNVVIDGDHVDDVVVDEAVAAADEVPVEPPLVAPAPRSRAWGLWSRKKGTPVEAVDPAADDEPAVEAGVEPEPEPEPVVEAEVEPEPELVAEVAEVAPEPEPPAPEPAPAPLAPAFVFAPAVDILPSRQAGGRFGRHRTATPVPASPAPAAPAAPAEAPTKAAPTPVAAVTEAPPETPDVAETSTPPADTFATVSAVQSASDESEPDAEPDLGPEVRPDPEPDLGPGPELPSGPPVEAAVPPRRQAAAVPVGAVGAVGGVDHLQARADLASSALSELRGLYAPSFAPATGRPVEKAADAGLTRRTPKSAPSSSAPVPTTATPRERTANDVRGMLSGFRAGVERGRAPQSDAADAQLTDHPTEKEPST